MANKLQVRHLFSAGMTDLQSQFSQMGIRNRKWWKIAEEKCLQLERNWGEGGKKKSNFDKLKAIYLQNSRKWNMPSDTMDRREERSDERRRSREDKRQNSGWEGEVKEKHAQTARETERERTGQGHASFPAIVKVKCRRSLWKHANCMQMSWTSGGGLAVRLTLSWKFPVQHTSASLRVAGCREGWREWSQKGVEGRLMKMKVRETVYLRIKESWTETSGQYCKIMRQI